MTTPRLPVTEDIHAWLRLSAGQRVLVVGCADGVQTLALAALVGPTGDVTGIDEDDSLLLLADMNAELMGVSQYVTHAYSSLHDLDFPDHYFDAIYCGYDLLQMATPAQTIAALHRVLKPGKRLAMAALSGDRLRALFAQHDFFEAILVPGDTPYLVARKK